MLFSAALILTINSLSSAPQEVVGGSWEKHTSHLGEKLEMLGKKVAGCSDLDGDSRPDYAATATWALSNGTKTGAVYAFSGADGHQLWRFVPAQPYIELGSSLAQIDDVDGDGTADLASGAPFASFGGWTFTGSVFVVSGRTGALIRRHDGVGDDQFFGYAVASVGDLGGDSIGELLVGAPRRNPNGVSRGGSGYVFSGASGALLFQVDGTHGLGFLGWSAAGLDDLDGDGLPEFCFSAPLASPFGKVQAGYVGIYSGKTGALFRGKQGQAVYDHFGHAIATCQDSDGDGLRELVVGAPEHGLQNVGAAYLYSGGSGPLVWKRLGENDHDQLGFAVAGGGDLDADGDPDVAIGAWTTDFGGFNAGSAYIHDAASGDLVHRIDGQEQSSGPLWFGRELAVVEDLQGNGVDDLIVGIPDAGGFDLNGAVEIHGLDPFLVLDAKTISVSSSTSVALTLDFPASEAGFRYAVLASGSGSGPTTIGGGLAVPLSSDALFLRLTTGWNPNLLQGGRGVLDSDGNSIAKIEARPSLTPYVGRTVYLASVSFDPATLTGRRSSIVRLLTILP